MRRAELGAGLVVQYISPASGIAQVLGAAVSGVAALVGVYVGMRAARRNLELTLKSTTEAQEATLRERANRAEIDELRRQLSTFLVPYHILARANFMISQDLRNR